MMNKIYDVARDCAERADTPNIKKIMEVVAKIQLLFAENNFSWIEKDLLILTLKEFELIQKTKEYFKKWMK